MYFYMRAKALFLVILIILSTCPVSYAKGFQECDLHFSDRKKIALAEAKKHFVVEILTKEIDGVLRTVILTGESDLHLQFEETTQIQNYLVEQFRLVGLEGGYAGQTGRKNYIRMIPNQEDYYRDDPSLSFLARTSFDGGLPENTETRFFFLEKGYELDIKELIASNPEIIHKVLQKIFEISSVAQLMNITLFPSLAMPWSSALIHCTWIASLIIYLGFSDSLQSYVSDSDILLKKRDPYMAENINDILSQDPEEDTMLIIVGRDHVPGIKKALEEQHGFVPTTMSLEQVDMINHALGPE